MCGVAARTSPSTRPSPAHQSQQRQEREPAAAATDGDALPIADRRAGTVEWPAEPGWPSRRAAHEARQPEAPLAAGSSDDESGATVVAAPVAASISADEPAPAEDGETAARYSDGGAPAPTGSAEGETPVAPEDAGDEPRPNWWSRANPFR